MYILYAQFLWSFCCTTLSYRFVFFLCFVFSSYEQASHKEFKIACLTVDDSSLGPGDEYVCLIII
jgi:hypothetical protein